MKKIMQYLLPTACAVGMFATAHAQNIQPITLEDGTAIPVRLSHSIDTAKVRPGDVVTAKTMQLVHAGNHVEIARGSLVAGHIIAVTSYKESSGEPASVILQFDRIRIGTDTVPVRFSIRAIASSYAAYSAEYLNIPQSQSPNAHAMIGGGRTTPGSRFLYSDDGDKIGYENGDGRYGALLASLAQDDADLQCAGTRTPQALAIFAPGACGVYGFDHVAMQASAGDDGAIQLTARRHNIALFSNSAMLLQVRNGSPQLESR